MKTEQMNAKGLQTTCTCTSLCYSILKIHSVSSANLCQNEKSENFNVAHLSFPDMHT